MKAQDYYFKKESRGCTKIDAATGMQFVDLEDYQPHIRIVGTKKEIDVLADEYMEKHNLQFYLDEVYDYDIPKKDSYWFEHPCFGTLDQYNKKMKERKENLKHYKEIYNDKGPFIV